MEEFEQALTDLFNQTALPFEAKRYVVLTFWHNVEEQYCRLKEQAKAKAKTKNEESEVEPDE